MSILSKLFGSKAPPPEPVQYEGFAITPEPQRDGSRFRVAARIEKVVGGDAKTHLMIRADTFESAEAAEAESLAKAKVFIDQMGDRLFD